LPAHLTLLAGVSGPATAAELASARREAEECLALHEVRRTGAAPVYDEAWDDILLQRLRVAAQSGRVPQRGPVAELREHDRTHSTRYTETLRAWLEAQGDLANAGQRLDVHENTVRYRLRKMAEVTNLGLDDARKRLAMMIELAVTDSLSEADNPP
jgi:sugar diacid utilization regulator